ncbi:50S ribosomal protein L1 [Chitinivibrio alkaliphilus]|uniref:Large ribosomal subunit protein uL1 n=1 Tax=Chitinivibrio alkaliphilus ACht1 TaxID=1313304 RepID=U7D622_9BACT|nr:50S ribosomal protein L1 [Chitinivibrio alkaliphilus]ERP31026.1 50S ribosomal protein L1 [Chitinivibrio alkaliphilus ACht1]
MKRSKTWRSVQEKIDKSKAYPLNDALATLKELSYVKFDETVDLAVRLGVDPRKSDQAIRGSVVLPGGLGKDVRVVAFVGSDKVEEAKEAGADIIGDKDLVEEIKKGFLDFDSVVATPDMMGVVGVLGKILGPRGMMPNPKVGTVTTDIANAVAELKAGRVEFRTEKGGIIHVPVGKLSFDNTQLVDNVNAVMGKLKSMKPSAAKGEYFKKVVLSSTMGPGLQLEASELV